MNVRSDMKAGAACYTVRGGDNLSRISQMFYGDTTQWAKVYYANQRAIGSNPNVIRTGMKLYIPD